MSRQQGTAGHVMRNPLTRPFRPAQNQGSLRKLSSTPANLLRSRDFYAPHSARRASARLARSMGVSGIRKDPDALSCVESTPTPFRVAFNLKKLGAIMAISNTPGADLRQSRSLQSLNRFTPAGINALAASALILFDAVNAGALIVNDQVEPVLATRTRTLLERLYTCLLYTSRCV